MSSDPDDPSAVLVRDSGDAKTSVVEWDNDLLAVDAVGSDGVAEGVGSTRRPAVPKWWTAGLTGNSSPPRAVMH